MTTLIRWHIWADGIQNYGDNTLGAIQSAARGGNLAAEALGELTTGQGLSGVIADAENTATAWRVNDFHPDELATLRNAENESPAAVQRALQTIAEARAHVTGDDVDTILVALGNEYRTPEGNGAAEATNTETGNTYIIFGEQGVDGTSVSDSGDIINSLAHGTSHTGNCDEDCATDQGNELEGAFAFEGAIRGQGSDTQSDEADAAWLLSNGLDPTLVLGTDALNSENQGALDHRQLNTTEANWIVHNTQRFAEQIYGSNPTPAQLAAAERRLAQQGFRQVQFGVGGDTDALAAAFLGTARFQAPGDISRPNFGAYDTETGAQSAFTAANDLPDAPFPFNLAVDNDGTDDQASERANPYINAFDPDGGPANADFNGRNGLDDLQPTSDQINAAEGAFNDSVDSAAGVVGLGSPVGVASMTNPGSGVIQAIAIGAAIGEVVASESTAPGLGAIAGEIVQRRTPWSEVGAAISGQVVDNFVQSLYPNNDGDFREEDQRLILQPVPLEFGQPEQNPTPEPLKIELPLTTPSR